MRLWLTVRVVLGALALWAVLAALGGNFRYCPQASLSPVANEAYDDAYYRPTSTPTPSLSELHFSDERSVR
jgi:hypothetical protein